MWETLSIRTPLLSDSPDGTTHRIHVKGQVATVLRFELPCDPARTKLLGWEGRFEPPLVGGRKVVLEPLRDLAPEEGVPLLVTLADGTEIPFLVRPPRQEEWGRADQQVNVFRDRESYDAVLSSLHDALKKKRVLEEQVERYRMEETSADHALAALLASGAIAQTPFVMYRRWAGRDEDAEVETLVFKGKDKAAVVFKVRNHDTQRDWSIKEARLMTVSGGQRRAVAVRATQDSIPPGASGAIAFVVDGGAFVEGGALTNLMLELYRHDGLRHAYVLLEHNLARK
ncbi:DUF2381 family protein [Myxococcus sp. RHSTA-1-4]|uniref:DUF2381 family protein n=1 Tax=Myxococcus sp. RHSTA-1-4 TaxID=2874601 RepID=UPI001CBEBC55|nr:DUF2381 family protein [Myxococcus sp. RHSTA-1-4]MBZ4417549.1 DUF2381 family protein [Myxococcus sp. RHSTA-1-4]